MNTYGYRDMRSAAELMLSPYRPALRVNVGTNTLRLGFGLDVPVPGVLSHASQLTGAVRQTLGMAIAVKQTAEMVGALIQQTIDDVKQAKGVVTGGVPALAAQVAASIPVPQIPGATAFVQVSALRPGQPIPASYTSILKDRQNQLLALASRMKSVATMAGFGGVSIQENYKRTPYPLQSDVDLPSVSKLAVGGPTARRDDVLRDKAKFLVTGVPTAKGKPSYWSRLKSVAAMSAAPGFNPALSQLFHDRSGAGNWSEPPSAYGAQFPYNKVTATESGHVIEIDDTPSAERIHIFHRSGSFVEFHPNGTVVVKNMKDGYLLTMNNQYVKVSGACHISVDGMATIYAKGDTNVQTDGSLTVTAKKDFNVYASNINLRARNTFRGDGTRVDLRYISLPYNIHPVMGALVPRVNLNALRADFPRGNFDKVLSIAAKGPLDPKTVTSLLAFNEDEGAAPVENPLSNPGVYVGRRPADIDYRSRLFDTPEETQHFELYNAHVEAQRQLGDFGAIDPRELSGQLMHLDESVAPANATVTFLNFDDYKGKFDYADTFALSPSFTLGDLVDTTLWPTVVPVAPAPTPGTVPVEQTVPSGPAGGAGAPTDQRPDDERPRERV
jgi:hypothetical protein